ncbi:MULTISPECIES: alpha/beta hydrolase [Parabacteroides]|uniref:alpha/beta hydrolase n=1 Tax=Parabacteroides provencensis TaxID=1944636 RepID=UPI000C147BDE|nr:alpha/beta hydrolase [Parabacteroides provencensis]
MKQRLFFTLLFTLFIINIHAQYVPDVLGDDYLRRTFQMPDDYEGKVVCTLVKKPQLSDVKQAVLYIHGYNDYFFQKQLGDSVNAHGYNFYAMDLRKYGRSILPNQNPFFCKSLKEYFADIDTALATIRAEGNNRILLMAHSTGGLITPYYLNSKKGNLAVDGLILNSPFLDWNFGWFMEKIVIPAVSFIGKFFPNLTVQGYGDPNYSYSLLKQYKGEWEYDTNWKMIFGHPKKAGWIHAIQEAQQTVQKGLKLDCPILVMSSNKSFPESKEWHNEYMTSDIVLNVHDIQQYGSKLGNYVTRDTIQNGIHDLILSEKPYRDHVYHIVFNWIKGL